MAKSNLIVENENLRRYKQNVIFNHGTEIVAFHDDSEGIYSEPSVTDKESYRITLASLRGVLSSNMGSNKVGQYSIKAGQDYDPNYDFSYLNRKDLTIVDIDNFIKHFKSNLENYDNELKLEIEKQLEKAESMKEVLQKETKNSNSDTPSE